MSSHKPPRDAQGVKTEGFSPLQKDNNYDRRPLYRVVEVVRNSEGRLRHEGRVWHNDLALLRKFGRAVAANTSSHRVMITDAVGDIIEELPVASPEARHSAWDSWEGLDLPPAPPVVRRAAAKVPQRPLTVLGSNSPSVEVENEMDVAVAAVAAAIEEAAAAEAAQAAPPAQTLLPGGAPPRDLPKLDVGQAEADVAGPVDEAVPMVPEHEATLP